MRYFLCGERITSVNDVDDLFYRIDMPGHIKHNGGDTFARSISAIRTNRFPPPLSIRTLAPDEKFLYQRKDDKIPRRMIRAYQVKLDGKPGPWLAG